MPLSPWRFASGSMAGIAHSTRSPTRNGMPRRSEGSICDRRMSIIGVPWRAATWATICDLPTPGGPHSMTGVWWPSRALRNSRSMMDGDLGRAHELTSDVLRSGIGFRIRHLLVRRGRTKCAMVIHALRRGQRTL